MQAGLGVFGAGCELEFGFGRGLRWQCIEVWIGILCSENRHNVSVSWSDPMC